MISRTLAAKLTKTAGPFPVLFLTGPRQSGKTTLARAAFPEYAYVSLEDLQSREEALEDPRGFLRRLEGRKGVILDEVQRAPDLFSYIQGVVDERRAGPFILTGSQQFLLSDKISQSLAGRAAIFELLPFSVAELAGRQALTPEEFAAQAVSDRSAPDLDLQSLVFSGLFPPIHDRKLDPTAWLDGYVRTYVERDVRLIAGVGNLDDFTRFLGLCAGRAGSLLNASSLASDAGVSHTTARKWLSILKAGYIVDYLRPHHRNYSKRLVKRPKIHFLDTGLLCRLLGIRKADDVRVHPLRGVIFENFIVAELRKLFLHHGERPPLFFWRDLGGLEVDVLIDLGARLIPIEIKAGETVASDFFRSLDRFLELSGEPGGVLVYGGAESHRRKEHSVRGWWDCT